MLMHTLDHLAFCVILYSCHISTIATKDLLPEDSWNSTDRKNISMPVNTTANLTSSEEHQKSLGMARLLKIYDPDQLCQKTWFLENYVSKERYVNIDDMRTLCDDTLIDKCNGVEVKDLYYQLMENLYKQEYFLRIQLSSINRTEGCWGYAFEQVTQDHKQTTYFNFKEKVTEKRFEIYYKIAFTYTFRIGALPRGKIFEFHWEAPGRCELEVLHDIYLKHVEKGSYWNKEQCSHTADLQERFAFAKNLCLLYEPDERRMILKEKLKFIDCKAVLSEKENEAQNKTTKISLSISAVLLLAIIFVFVLLARKNKLKFYRAHKMVGFDLGDEELDAKSAQPKEATSVVIIHRPGCEEVELFVVDFAGLLKSYGIDVRMTLLEQTMVDAVGGIAYYMQKNIQQCDFVLILLTEPAGDDPLQRHRPFQFALAMMQGLAVQTNQYSKYIPLYLTSYYEAVKHFPPFLNANPSYGYRLPHETIRLVARLLETTNLKQSKQRTAKDKQFVSRLKDCTKAIQQRKHTNCINGQCRKGTQYASVSNLSSAWASTVPSKWPSFKSLMQDDICNVDYQSDFHFRVSPSTVDVLRDLDECLKLKVDLQKSNKKETEQLVVTHLPNHDLLNDNTCCLTNGEIMLPDPCEEESKLLFLSSNDTDIESK